MNVGFCGIFRNTLLSLAAVCACASLAGAQAPRDKNDAVYMYRGADRDQRLV